MGMWQVRNRKRRSGRVYNAFYTLSTLLQEDLDAWGPYDGFLECWTELDRPDRLTGSGCYHHDHRDPYLDLFRVLPFPLSTRH